MHTKKKRKEKKNKTKKNEKFKTRLKSMLSKRDSVISYKS